MPDFTDKLKPSYDGGAILEAERKRSNISVDELSRHLLSRDNFLEKQKKITPILEKEPLFRKSQLLNLSRPERYHLGLARAKLLRRMVKKHGWDEADYHMAQYLIDEVSPYTLHDQMFATTVREQGSDEQKKYWIPRIESWKMLGAYAQTELGHGSNVRGLETLAKWDPKTKTFIIHSPYLTASKWWNGTMGRTATHTIVVAQLMTPKSATSSEYVSHGPQPFVVQIRDEKTHLPLEGIVVGDIGPKYGYTSMDNGYMLFDNFRVPHSAMLSRYTQLNPETGEIKRQGHAGTVYGSLTYVRAQIVMHSRLVLARAVTIAVRYTAIRKQFSDRDATEKNAPELAVLDYPTVQIRILPLLATAFALHYTGEAMYDLYYQSRAAIEKGDFSSIAELHSTSSGLKSLCTTYASNGIETCRRAMGGHGFGGGSGLILLNNDYLSKPTVEGDNWMITQQVARYLIKKMDVTVKGEQKRPFDTTDKLFRRYMTTKGHHYPSDIFSSGQANNAAIVEAFRWRAADLSYQAYYERIVRKRNWNSLLIQLHKLSNAYSEMKLVENFAASLRDSKLPKETTVVMSDLFQLFALYTMDSDSRVFETTNAVTPASLNQLQNAILILMAEKIRPHAVALVDSWAMPDYLLNSAMGRYDGKVYENLYDLAHRQNPLNRVTFNVDWESDEIVKGSGDRGRQVLAKL